MKTTIEAVKGGTVFGEIMAHVAANQPIERLHSETVVHKRTMMLETKSGQFISVVLHEIFIENKINASRTADVRMIVSLDVNSDDDKEAFFEANSKINEINIVLDSLILESINGMFFFLKVKDFSINWNGFLHSDQC